MGADQQLGKTVKHPAAWAVLRLVTVVVPVAVTDIFPRPGHLENNPLGRARYDPALAVHDRDGDGNGIPPVSVH
jgi:hypothetical protein